MSIDHLVDTYYLTERKKLVKINQLLVVEVYLNIRLTLSLLTVKTSKNLKGL